MSRGRLFGSLCSLVLLVNLARVMFAPLLTTFITVFDLSEATAGLVVTLVWFGGALSRIPTGWLLTRVSRQRAVLGTGGILSVASVFTAMASTVPALAAGAFSMGFASGIYFVAANPLVSELYPGRVGRMMGIHGTASQLAAVAAAPFVGLTLLYNWRISFVVVGVAAAAVTVALFVAASRAEIPNAGAGDRHLVAAAVRQWRIIAVGVVVLGVTGFVWQGLFNFLPLYMQTKGLRPETADAMLTVIFAAGVPAFFISGRLADRLPRVPYLLGIVIAFAIGLVVLTRVHRFAVVVAVTVVVGYVIHSLFPAMDTYLLDTLPDDNRASAYAVYSGTMMFVQALGASVVGTLRSADVPFDTIFVGFAAVLVVVVVSMVVLEGTDRLPS